MDTKSFFMPSFFIPLFIPLFLSTISCIPGQTEAGLLPLDAPAKTKRPVEIAALMNEAEISKDGEDSLEDSRLVLKRGNSWTTGIPGFRENALSAFSGEYIIPGRTEVLTIWLSKEFFHYDGWTDQNMGNRRVLQKTEPGGLLTAVFLNDAWTAIFLFPPEVQLEETARIINSCVNRFSGFGLQTALQDISLPALISF